MNNKGYFLPVSITIALFLIFGAVIWNIGKNNSPKLDVNDLSEADNLWVESVTLPVDWSSIGKNMVDAGVIDMEKFLELYELRGGLSDEVNSLLNENEHKKIIMTKNNSQELLNVLWAFGLANKSNVLENGEMMNPKYGDAGRFASTGGWSLSKGNPMDHYSAHKLISLSSEKEDLVKRVADNIYRPCCGNPTSFPDCNHGMAMLGLLELMASEGLSEAEMYDTALKVNSLWFPSTYKTIAKYFTEQGINWKDIAPKEILGKNYSSISGYRNVLKAMESSGGLGASCGV